MIEAEVEAIIEGLSKQASMRGSMMGKGRNSTRNSSERRRPPPLIDQWALRSASGDCPCWDLGPALTFQHEKDAVKVTNIISMSGPLPPPPPPPPKHTHTSARAKETPAAHRSVGPSNSLR